MKESQDIITNPNEWRKRIMKTLEADATLTLAATGGSSSTPAKSKGGKSKTPATIATNPRTNPYFRGNYKNLFDWMMSHKGKPFLVSAMLEYAKTLTDKDGNLLGDQKDENGAPTDKAIRATLAVILGPRKESKRGDCRGNASAEGHVYYVQPVAVDFKDMPEGTSKREWKKSNRKMILRWREPMLAPLYRKGDDGLPMTPKRKPKAEKAETVSKGKAEKTAKTPKAEKVVKAETPAKGKKKVVTVVKTFKSKGKGKKASTAAPEVKPSASSSFNASKDGYKADDAPEAPASETGAPDSAPVAEAPAT